MTEIMPFKTRVLIPLAVLALGTIAAFLVAINHNFDQLARLWAQGSSTSNSWGLPTPLCFAVLFFQAALDSTRSKFEEAAIIGFLAGLSTITATERIRCEMPGLQTPTAHPLQGNGQKRTPEEERRSINAQERRNKIVGLSRRVVDNLTIPWLLYNLAAGALAWQAIIIPAFLYEQHSTRSTTSSRPKQLTKTNATSENIAITLGVALGLLAPSTLMIINPASTATILVWLVFPIWVSLIQWAVHFLSQRLVPVSTVINQGANVETKLGPLLAPYALPIIYSIVSHFLLVKNLCTQEDDRDPLTRSAVLLLEIDHVAIFVAFLYWAWAKSAMTATVRGMNTESETETLGSNTVRPKNGLQAVFVTLLSSLFLGPGAGVCLGWVVAGLHEHQYDQNSARIRPLRDVNPDLDSDTPAGCQSDQGDDSSSDLGGLGSPERKSIPRTPSTNTARRARARSSPKATGHFFGGPLAD